jgi:carbamoyl-phosphate synthase large subunit
VKSIGSLKHMTVLVTSIGASPALAVIKGLTQGATERVSVVGIDCDPYSAGFAACDVGYVSPRIGEKRYCDFVKTIALRHRVSTIFPILEEELFCFSAREADFNKCGIRLVINDGPVLKSFLDKLRLSRLCATLGINVPRTFRSDELISADVRFPLVLKRRSGRRVGDIVIARCTEDLAKAMRAARYELVGQALVRGKEYTTEVVCDCRGETRAVVTRERLQTKAGVCVKARFVHHTQIDSLVNRLTRSFRIRGPFNVQSIETFRGKVYLIDVNPKFPGGGGLTLAAGVNVPHCLLKVAHGLDISDENTHYKEGLIVASLPQEVVLPSPKQEL